MAGRLNCRANTQRPNIICTHLVLGSLSPSNINVATNNLWIRCGPAPTKPCSPFRWTPSSVASWALKTCLSSAQSTPSRVHALTASR